MGVLPVIFMFSEQQHTKNNFHDQQLVYDLICWYFLRSIIGKRFGTKVGTIQLDNQQILEFYSFPTLEQMKVGTNIFLTNIKSTRAPPRMT